uniref:Mannosyltransferase n=1 Tax=Acrobeloides nanus TaxID=290746 RepID=A0A914CKT7_9BILA
MCFNYYCEFVPRKVDLLKAIGLGLATLGITLLFSIPIDSLFWWRLVYPEGEVFWFNAIMNRSHEWGTSPFLWYFYSAIPRALLTSLLLVPLGLWLERRLYPIVLPAFAFVFIYSFVPHKELRFIIYSFPLLNLPAAVFCARMWINRDKSFIRKLVAWGMAAHLLANLLISGTFLYASAMNYPSGDALAHLQFKHRYMRNKPVSVYIDPYSAMNGINKFLHLYPDWEYNKTENLTPNDLARFDYIVLGSQTEDVHSLTKNFTATHKEYFTVEAFQKIVFKRFFWRNLLVYPVIKYKEKVIVFKKLN